MSQVSSKLRRGEQGYFHWCPGCEETHRLPDTWNFNGDLENPTFTPSFKHTGTKRIFENGKWTGEWVKDTFGNVVPFICHYNLTSGILEYCNDCSHSLVSKNIPLPLLPECLRD